jgi:hypothetical protein
MFAVVRVSVFAGRSRLAVLRTTEILEVTRREGSIVELRRSLDPVGRYLEDALAVAGTAELPSSAAAHVVPGLCRLALEATCMEVVRRRPLTHGETHATVERALTVAGLLAEWPASAEVSRTDAEVDLGRSGSGEPLMRLNVGVVGEHGVEAMLQVGRMDDAPDVQQLLHRFPQPLYDGDGAVLADGAKALADAKGSDVGAERFARELRTLCRLPD